MPPKRKRTAAAEAAAAAATPTSDPKPSPVVTRRATRQMPSDPPVRQAPPTTQTPVPIPTPTAHSRPSQEPVAARRTASTAADAGGPGAAPAPGRRLAPAATTPAMAVLDKGRLSDLVAPEITYHVPQPLQPGRAPTSLVRPHGPWAPPPQPPLPPPPTARRDSRRQAQSAPPAAVTPSRPLASRHPNKQAPRPDRNIDKVVLGNLCFRTWYPSQYGKEVLGDGSANAKDGAKKGQPMLERLYVCPSCFKYAKELVAWRGHVRLCERRRHVPGTKIYVHPRGRRTVLVAQAAKAKRRRGDGGVRYVEELVEDEGEWSIWEVDGEKDGLFCQNLSLFAKLFLDNKSVFFDVTGFYYYLLVYTPRPSEPGPPQITGFFSKEKMSWDNNNLACILVFPPWQRKGLGGLLIGASYEMSRREGIMGGPEKPISELGKKGYRRFWTGAVARWLLALETDDEGEAVVDVEDISRGTWISPDDCLGVLRDMGLVQDAGTGPGKAVAATAGPVANEDDDEDDEDEDEDEEEDDGDDGAPPEAVTTATGGARPDAGAQRRPLVPRVRVDKEAVRRFVAANAISLEPTCDGHAFVDHTGRRADGGRGSADEGGEA